MLTLSKTESLGLNFADELNHFFNKRLTLLFWVGVILFPFFLNLDYLVVHEHFYSFLMYRCLVVVSFLVLLSLHKKKYGKRHPFLIAILGYICCGAAISTMVVQTGGYDSFYYVGMICLIVAFTSILPLNFFQSIASGIMMYLIYVIPVLLFSKPDNESLLLFFNNNFFFLFFFIVSVVKNRKDYSARENEFLLRKDLDYYANNLQLEVKKRIKKHEESELRYKALYENIIDSLVLIDSNARILLANSIFYQLIYGKGAINQNFNFLEFVHSNDHEIVTNQILDKLQKNIDIRNVQFRMTDQNNQTHHVECSARAMPGSNIQSSEKGYGYQLVIRDISSRKKLEDDLITSFETITETRTATIMGLAKLTEYRDNETGSHLERIQQYSRVLATQLGSLAQFCDTIDHEYIETLCLSSILHDIGKVGIPDAILLKPGPLTSDEFNIIKKHSVYGGDALKAVESRIKGESFLKMGKEIAYFHHEKWNGQGYPFAAKGDEIPLSARIVAVVDVYDALTSKRVYKEPLPHDLAIDIIQQEKGRHFDPDIVKAFLSSANQFNQIHKKIA